MQESFEIEQVSSLIDFYRVSISLLFKNQKVRRVYYFILIVGVILSLMEFLSPRPHLIHVATDLMIGVLFPFLFVTVSTFVLTSVLYLIRPDHFKATFFFNNWGMIKKTRTGEYSRPWKGILKWKETKSNFLLFIAENDAHIIAKKNLSETDLSDFRRFLEIHLGLF